jgi:hypothetical protein
MLSKKSKIEESEKSHKNLFSAASAAASRRRTCTKPCGDFLMGRCGPSPRRASDVPAARKNFVHHSRNTFSTASTHCGRRQSNCFALRDFLLDHLVGDGEQHWRHLDAERPRRLQVDGEYEPGRQGPEQAVSAPPQPSAPSAPELPSVSTAVLWHIDKSALPISEPRRYRDRAHLEFVASQRAFCAGGTPPTPIT